MINPLQETEHDIQSAILAYLEIRGHFIWRNNSGVVTSQYTYKRGERKGQTKTRRWRAGMKGSSDILGVAKDGKFIAVEVKRPGEDPDVLQEYFLDQVRQRGGYAVVARSLEDVQNTGL